MQTDVHIAARYEIRLHRRTGNPLVVDSNNDHLRLVAKAVNVGGELFDTHTQKIWSNEIQQWLTPAGLDCVQGEMSKSPEDWDFRRIVASIAYGFVPGETSC